MIVSKHDLKRHIQEDQSDRFLIADLYQSISSIYEFSNNPIDAFRSLVKTHNTLRVVGYDEIDEDALVQKIINMLLEHPEIYNEHAFPVSNSRLISAVLSSAYEAYTTREISKASCLFAACVKLCSDSGLRDDAINNLLFMVRRKETEFEVNYSVELFESATDKTSLILVINYVLYLLSRDAVETAYEDVLKLISTARKDQKSIMTVVGWWKEIQFVGEDESERVMRILSDSGLYSLESNSVISDSSVQN